LTTQSNKSYPIEVY